MIFRRSARRPLVAGRRVRRDVLAGRTVQVRPGIRAEQGLQAGLALSLKRLAYRWLLGYRIGKGVRFSFGGIVVGKSVELGDHVEIGLLAIVRDAFHQGMHIAGADRLVVVNRGSIIQPLPLAYRDRLARIPGVTQVTFATWFGGLYRDVRHSFPQFAIDRETYRQMFPECIVPDEQWQSFLADREGAIVGEALAERFKWNVGDRVPIKGALFPGAWELAAYPHPSRAFGRASFSRKRGEKGNAAARRTRPVRCRRSSRATPPLRTWQSCLA